MLGSGDRQDIIGRASARLRVSEARLAAGGNDGDMNDGMNDDRLDDDKRRGPLVVVKRRRALDAPAAPATDDAQGANESRAPRVFRAVAPIDAAADDADAAAGSPEPVAADAAPTLAVVAPEDVGRVARRSRRKLHGKPRVVYSAVAEGANGDEDSAASRAAQEAASLLRERPPEFDLAGLGPSDGYRSLMDRISALETQATQLRRSETLTWIREAIAQYGLSAADLGF